MDPQENIPPFHLKLFKLLCKEEFYHELAGDLEENFAENLKVLGIAEAQKIYKKEVFKMLRPSVIRTLKILPTFTPFDMLKSYFKISVRNLIRDKKHSLISIFGLAAGIVASVLVFQYTNFESSYDSFHNEEDGKVYRMTRRTVNIESGEEISINATNFHGFHPAVSVEIPEVKYSAKLLPAVGVLTLNDRGHNIDDVIYSTGSLFDVFSFELKQGDKYDLDKPGSVFLSETVSKRIFGSNDPMGQSIHYNDNFSNVDIELVVNGIYKDFPDNSHLKAGAMLSFPDLESFAGTGWFGSMTIPDVTWRWVGFYNYIKAQPGADLDRLTEKLNDFIQKYRAAYDETQGRRPIVLPEGLEALHFSGDMGAQLEPSGDRATITMFKFIGILIVLIAWINFVNFSSARAINRAKEVGVRKVLGAFKKQLIHQFLFETLLINLLALSLSAGIIWLIIPTFHEFIGVPAFDYFLDYSTFWYTYLLVFVIGAIASGLYPALVITRFEPMQVLRGNFKHSSSGIWLRRSLMFLQFGLVLLMMSGILTIRSQINFMMDQDIGMNIDQTVVVNAPPAFLRDSTYRSKIEAFRGTLEQVAGIKGTSHSSSLPGIRNNFGQTIYRTDRPSDESVFIYRSSIDPQFLSFFDIELVAGRGFDESLKGDANVILINETSAKELGFDTPTDAINKRLVYPTQGEMRIVGVVKDFNQMGLNFPVEPIAMDLDTGLVSQYINVRLGVGNIVNTMAAVEESFSSFFPSAPVDSFFLDQTFNDIYEEDRKFRSVLEFFAIVAIFISCLGIFGLSSFLINQKLKEIGIRKVLGADLSEIIRVLTKEYLMLIVVSTVIAVPIAYFLIQQWLNGFLVRIGVNPMMFVFPVIGLILILFLTIGHKTWRAARSNPVRVLKNE